MKGKPMLSRLLLVAGVAFFLLGASSSASAASIKVGKPAPDFSLVDWHEEGSHSLADFKNENVVLVFGCTTCWDFVKQIKALNGMVKKYKGKPIKFVTVYTREADSKWQPKNAFERTQTALMLGFAHPILTMQTIRTAVWIDDMNDSVFKAYGGVHGSVVIVDGKGKVAYQANSIDPDALAGALDNLL